MESRFGLKDAVLLALVVSLGVMVFLLLRQEDRQWAEMRSLRRTIEEQAKLLAEVRREIAAGREAKAGAAGRRDEWARPGVPITVPPAWTCASDPRSHPDFAEGGVITEILDGAPQRLTPYIGNDPFAHRIVQETVLECLAAYDSRTLDLRGWLAEAWQADPAGLWLRVKIRDEACFSDGEPVTAEDVRFTVMDYVLNESIDAGPSRSEVGLIRGVRVIGPKVVEFEFKEARYNNLRAALRNAVLPARFYSRFTPERLNASTGLVFGSGPYRLESAEAEAEWSPPKDVVLVRNERYWGDRPPPDRLRFTFAADTRARLAEFENGRGDVMRSTPEQHAAKAKDPAFLERARALAWTNMRSGYLVITWNCGERRGRPTPFADARVRRAMTLALDRDRINRDFYGGMCEVATGPFPRRQAEASIEPWPFDMNEASRLLAEAGWADRDGDGVLEDGSGRAFEWELTYPTGSAVGERVGPYIQDQCARLGVRVTLRAVDPAALGQIRRERDFDATPVQWSWSGPEYDPFQTLHSSQAEGGDNFGQWRNARADALMDRGRGTVDETERMAVWRELHRIIHEEQPSTYLLNVPWTRFVSRRIENVHPYPVGFDRREWFVPRDRQ